MIKIENLNYKIGEINVLKNINLEIEKNNIVVILGVNGCGKSTLIKCIASLLKYTGKITLEQNILSNLNSKIRSRQISYLPQNCIKTNIKVKTLINHSRFPYLSFGNSLSSNDKNIIKKSIELTGIEKIINKNVMDISGGERQLAYLTMVLAQNTPIILLDEPNTFLDIEHQIFLFNLIKDLNKLNKTIIIVLHDIIQALDIADKIILMDKGEIVNYGKPSEIKKDIEKLFNVKISKVKEVNDYNKEPLFEYCLTKDN